MSGLQLLNLGGANDRGEWLFRVARSPSGPSVEYQSFAAAWWPQYTYRQFDDRGFDYALIHTFSGWTGPVCGATLELHLRSEGSSNDSVRLMRTGSTVPASMFRWWMTIRTVTGTWDFGDEAILRLDLADLPAYGGFQTNLLDDLQAGHLDLLIEDDTIIDDAVLTICECGPVSVRPTTWSALKSRTRD